MIILLLATTIIQLGVGYSLQRNNIKRICINAQFHLTCQLIVIRVIWKYLSEMATIRGLIHNSDLECNIKISFTISVSEFKVKK